METKSKGREPPSVVLYTAVPYVVVTHYSLKHLEVLQRGTNEDDDLSRRLNYLAGNDLGTVDINL